MYIYIDTKIVLHPLFHEHENNKMKTFLWQHFFFFFFDMSVHTLQGTMKCKNINVMLCVTTNKKTIKLLIIVDGVNGVRWLVGIYYKQKLGKILWNVSLTTNICKSNLPHSICRKVPTNLGRKRDQQWAEISNEYSKRWIQSNVTHNFWYLYAFILKEVYSSYSFVLNNMYDVVNFDSP